MAKGKRLSDPEALSTVEAKLDHGESFTEADRPLLKRLARLDLIRLIEGHYGKQLKTSTKNSVQRLVEYLLGPEPEQETDSDAAAASSPEAEAVASMGTIEQDAAVLWQHGLTVEGLAALAGALVPGLADVVLGLAAKCLNNASSPAAAPAAEHDAATEQELAASLLMSLRPSVQHGKQEEEFLQHLPLQPKQQQEQQLEQQEQQASHRQDSGALNNAAVYNSLAAWDGSMRQEATAGAAAATTTEEVDGGRVDEQLPMMDEMEASFEAELDGSFMLRSCSSVASDVFGNMAALTEEMMAQQQPSLPAPSTRDHTISDGSNGVVDASALPQDNSCDMAEFCLEQLLNDAMLCEPSNTNSSNNSNNSGEDNGASTTLLWSAVRSAPTKTVAGTAAAAAAVAVLAAPPAAEAAAAAATALPVQVSRKRAREDSNSPYGPFAHPHTAQAALEHGHSNDSSDTCLDMSSEPSASLDFDVDLALARVLAEALEMHYGKRASCKV